MGHHPPVPAGPSHQQRAGLGREGLPPGSVCLPVAAHRCCPQRLWEGEERPMRGQQRLWGLHTQAVCLGRRGRKGVLGGTGGIGSCGPGVRELEGFG